MNKYAFILLLALPSLTWGQRAAQAPIPDSLQYLVINSQEEGFGYMIFHRGNLLILQDKIPALSYAKGFSRKEDAEKTARLVVKKLSSNTMPPNVSLEELKALQIYELR